MTDMWCEHYQRDGLKDGQACKKGIVYDELTEVARLGRTGCARRLPCIKANHDEENRKEQPLCFCPHLEWRSEERMEHDRQVLMAGVARMDMVERLVLTPIRKTHACSVKQRTA